MGLPRLGRSVSLYRQRNFGSHIRSPLPEVTSEPFPHVQKRFLSRWVLPYPTMVASHWDVRDVALQQERELGSDLEAEERFSTC
jgi:hypothetical protein